MRRSTFTAVMLIALTIFGWPRVALAEAELVEVRYSAPAGCSSRDAFVRELALRTARVRVVAAPAAGATFVVELQDRASGVVGQLGWLEPDAAETVRAVSGATCEEVVSALALIAAVLVDPASLTRSPTSPPHAAAPIPREQPEPWRLRPTFGVGARVATAFGPGWSLGPGLEQRARNGARRAARSGGEPRARAPRASDDQHARGRRRFHDDARSLDALPAPISDHGGAVRRALRRIRGRQHARCRIA